MAVKNMGRVTSLKNEAISGVAPLLAGCSIMCCTALPCAAMTKLFCYIVSEEGVEILENGVIDSLGEALDLVIGRMGQGYQMSRYT